MGRWQRIEELDPFYRILLAGAVIVGIAAVATGLGTDNTVFLLLGIGWLLGGIAVVFFASSREVP